MNRDSPKAYKEPSLAEIKQRKRRSKGSLQSLPAQASECEMTSPHWMTLPSEDSGLSIESASWAFKAVALASS